MYWFNCIFFDFLWIRFYGLFMYGKWFDDVGSWLLIISRNIVRDRRIVIFSEIFFLDFGGRRNVRIVIDDVSM